MANIEIVWFPLLMGIVQLNLVTCLFQRRYYKRVCHLLNQDPESIGLKSSSSSLRKDLKSVSVEKDWSIKGAFIYRERDYEDKGLWIRNIWEWNHFDDYVKYLPKKRIIPYFAHDLQAIEVKALNEIERIRDKDKIWR